MDINKKEYNLTCNDRVHKYTINLPIDLYEKAKKVSRAAGIYRVSIYFRAIIEREVNSQKTLTMDDIMSAQKESVRIASAEHRREKLDLIEKNHSRKFFSKILDIFQDRQLYLFPDAKRSKFFDQ